MKHSRRGSTASPGDQAQVSDHEAEVQDALHRVWTLRVVARRRTALHHTVVRVAAVMDEAGPKDPREDSARTPEPRLCYRAGERKIG